MALAQRGTRKRRPKSVRARTTMRFAVVPVTTLAMLGFSAAAPAQHSSAPATLGCLTSELVASPAAISGKFALNPGSSARRVHRNGHFTDGRAKAVYRVPRRAGGPVKFMITTRGNGAKTGYRAMVKRNNRDKLKLVLMRREDGNRDVLGRTRLPGRVQSGDILRIVLLTKGNVVRAKAWVGGTRRPAWQVSRKDARPLPGGLPAGRAWLSRQADRGVTLRLKRLGPKVLDEQCIEEVVAEEEIVVNDEPEAAAIACTRLGVYNGMDLWHGIDAYEGWHSYDMTKDEFGAYPDLANSYYLVHKRINMDLETNRIERGISPNMSLMTQGTQYHAALAEGPTHWQYAEASAWLDARIDDLVQLSTMNPGVPVYATLDHEFHTRVRRGLFTGDSAKPDVYGQSLNVFYDRVRGRAPNVRVTYWIIGWDRTFEGTTGDQFTSPPDAIVFDPYAKTGSPDRDTIREITSGDLSWIRSQDWYVGQEIGLGEFGMMVDFGDPALADFYTDVRRQLAEQGIDWAVLFNRPRDNDHQIAGRDDGQQFPAAVTAFSGSLGGGC